MKQRLIIPALQGLCPCGKTFYAFQNPPAIAHDQPTCSEFDRLQPDEYLMYVRKAIEAATK